ncbi:MAG: Lrp/AsnC family transcriptional regulator [Bacteroidales bacterium]|jgi:Lrp/AsnC family leucine-responsive transcriptional regulator|nr:Lrp/AsnC family transcriptional regulator [Bacteroidales bacterium]
MSERTERLDRIDLQILRLLQENSDLKTKELAEAVGLSTTPVFERQRRLEREGYIKRYIAELDMEKINYGFVVFCNVKLQRINNSIATAFVEAIKGINEVAECYNISGEYDYLLKIYAADMKSYQHFVLNVLGKIESIGDIRSIFVLDTIKRMTGIQLPEK